MFSRVISFLFITSFFVDLPIAASAGDPRFVNCNQPFECGKFTNLYYPFWGKSRPEYCGHPSFELECLDDNSVEIVIQAQRYNVLYINEQSSILRIAAKDTWNSYCPSSFHNISLPSYPFNSSSPLIQHMILAYGCPSRPATRKVYRFPCSINGSYSENYFWLKETMAPTPDFSRCNITVIIPIAQPLVSSFINMQSTVENVTNEGFQVTYYTNATFCDSCKSSGGQCGYDIGTEQNACFCNNGSCVPRPLAVKGGGGIGLKARIGIGLSVLAVAIVAVVLFLKYVIKWKPQSWKKKTLTTMNFEAFLKDCASLAPKRYSFKEIKIMTKSFKNKLGHGGYGSVFKGVLNDGKLVAVKVLSKNKGNGEEFINEVASISRTSHVNIVSLLGYCFDGSKRALVYDFMPNGSLEKYIYDKDSSEKSNKLEWATIYQIAVGIARGLGYLHRCCNTRILHFDIKPHNILLDQDFCPKISDFGLAKLCPRKESIISMLGARGTAGYIAPEVFCRNFGGISHKSDVYSYGMMILEMVGGRKNIALEVEHTSEIYFPHWIHKRIELNEGLGLHGVVTEAQVEMTRKMILIGLWCIQTNPLDRPAMSRVLEMFEGSLEVLEIPPKPYLSSPSSIEGG